jgi:hypothetical protein
MTSMTPNFMRRKPTEGKSGAPNCGVFCDQTEEKVKAVALAKPVPRKWRRLSMCSPKKCSYLTLYLGHAQNQAD